MTRSMAMTIAGLTVTTAIATATYPTTALAGARNACPCAASRFFSSFISGQRNLVACTDNTPAQNFVRLVDSDLNLVVLYEFPPQLFCGMQSSTGATIPVEITPDEFTACQYLMLRSAALRGVPCLPE